MESINIAVIGAEGVGKSTFIQQLRRAPRPSTMNITSLRHELDGTPYLVTLVELDLEGIELDPNQPVHWPKQIGGHMVPRMDGAMILYDAIHQEDMTDSVEPLMCEFMPLGSWKLLLFAWLPSYQWASCFGQFLPPDNYGCYQVRHAR